MQGTQGLRNPSPSCLGPKGSVIPSRAGTPCSGPALSPGVELPSQSEGRGHPCLALAPGGGIQGEVSLPSWGWGPPQRIFRSERLRGPYAKGLSFSIFYVFGWARRGQTPGPGLAPPSSLQARAVSCALVARPASESPAPAEGQGGAQQCLIPAGG